MADNLQEGTESEFRANLKLPTMCKNLGIPTFLGRPFVNLRESNSTTTSWRTRRISTVRKVTTRSITRTEAKHSCFKTSRSNYPKGIGLNSTSQACSSALGPVSTEGLYSSACHFVARSFQVVVFPAPSPYPKTEAENHEITHQRVAKTSAHIP